MRLTLRTLLAYLDDRLSPAHARELGQKVSNSPFATELADRIRDVLRRRRLATEAAGRKTVDANLIAEYLDDQLTPELVALIEREILASDHSLAEVAASHQILGLLNDPVDLEPGLRRRLMAMSPESDSDGSSESANTSPGEVPEWKPLAPPEAARRRSPFALLVVMVLGWLVLLATDSNLFQKPSAENTVAQVEQPAVPVGKAENSGQPQENEPEPTVATGVGESSAVQAEDEANVAAQQVPAEQAVANSDVENGDVAMREASSESPPVEKNAEGSEAPPTTGSTAVAMIDQPASTASDTGQPEKVVDASDPEASEPVQTVSDVQQRSFELTDAMSMLLTTDAETGAWTWKAAAQQIPVEMKADGAILAVPAPFTVDVSCVEAGWKISALSQTLFGLVSEKESGVSLFEGRVFLTGTAVEDPESFELRVGGEIFILTVPKAEGVLAIEAKPLPSPGGVEDVEAADQLTALLPLMAPCKIAIHAVEGDAQIQREGQEAMVVKSGTTLLWRTQSSGELEPEIEDAVPEWVFEAAVPPADVTLKSHAIVAEALRSGSSLSEGVNILSRHRNPDLAAYSAMIPAMLRSLDELVTLLIESEQGTVRREAIRGLTTIAQQSAGGSDRVKQALGNRLSEAEMENAVRLVEGVTVTAAEDPDTSSWLVSMLSEGRLTIRELAIFNLEEIIGDRLGYFADDDRRSTSIRRWTRLLEKNEGRLVVPVEE